LIANTSKNLLAYGELLSFEIDHVYDAFVAKIWLKEVHEFIESCKALALEAETIWGRADSLRKDFSAYKAYCVIPPEYKETVDINERSLAMTAMMLMRTKVNLILRVMKMDEKAKHLKAIIPARTWKFKDHK